MSLEKRNGTVSAHGPEPETQPHHKAGAAEYIAGLRLRAEATYRSERRDCCHHADPWTCRCHDKPEPPERDAEGWATAARHLWALGLLPAPNLPAMRVMWRRGGADRRLVREISERWELAA